MLMSRAIPGGGGARGGRRFVFGGRAGRGPGRGTSTATRWPLTNKPPRGYGSKKLGGRPPKGPGGYTDPYL
jgi:hypothetical protein